MLVAPSPKFHKTDSTSFVIEELKTTSSGKIPAVGSAEKETIGGKLGDATVIRSVFTQYLHHQGQ